MFLQLFHSDSSLNTDLSCSNISEFISPLAKGLVALSNSTCFIFYLPGNVHLHLNRYVVHLFWKSILFPLLLFFVLRGLQFNWVTYAAFGNAFIYLCSVSSKDLQVVLELQHDEENFITEHLETFFFFPFSKILNLIQVLKMSLCRSENAKCTRCWLHLVLYHQIFTSRIT